MEKKYVGAGQTAVMLSLFGVLYCVSRGQFYNTGVMLINAVCSALTAGLLIIPLVLLSRRTGESLAVTSAGYGIIGRVILFPYAIYFIFTAADFLKKYSVFVNERYFSEGSLFVIILLMGLVCVYVSHTGAETVCRMSTVLLFMLTAAFIFYFAAGGGDIALYDLGRLIPHNFSIQENCFNGLFPSAAAGAMCIAVLCRGMGKNTRKGAYLGLALTLFASGVIIFGAGAVMNDYLTVSEYPVTDAVIYVSRKMTFRPDGVFFTLWTIIAAAVISLLSACSGHFIKVMIPAVKGEGMISAALVTACAYLCSGFCGMVHSLPWVNFTLLFAVPLIFYLIVKNKS